MHRWFVRISLCTFPLLSLYAQEDQEESPPSSEVEVQVEEEVQEPVQVPTLFEQGIRLVNIDGIETSLEPFKGDLILVVPFASESGFSDQMISLEFLQKQFSSYGLSILAFPTNDFGDQEPRSEAEIKEWLQANYEVSFPLFARAKVNGEEAHPLFAYLKASGAKIEWNFSKIFLDREGRFALEFPPWQDPSSPLIVTEIIKLLRGQENLAPKKS